MGEGQGLAGEAERIHVPIDCSRALQYWGEGLFNELDGIGVERMGVLGEIRRLGGCAVTKPGPECSSAVANNNDRLCVGQQRRDVVSGRNKRLVSGSIGSANQIQPRRGKSSSDLTEQVHEDGVISFSEFACSLATLWTSPLVCHVERHVSAPSPARFLLPRRF